jgi:hypothetical protein
MAQTPSRKAVPFTDISWTYGAHQFQDALADFIAGINNPGLGGRTLHACAANTLLPFHTIQVYHNIKFTASSDARESEIVDAVHVRPEQKDSCGRTIPARFDTVLIRGSGRGKFICTEALDLVELIILRLPNCPGSGGVPITKQGRSGGVPLS